MPGLTVSEIAAICNGEVRGDATRVIQSANTIEDAGPHDISFVANNKAENAAAQSQAACLIVPQDFSASGDWSLVLVKNSRGAFAQILQSLYPSPSRESGCHPTAVIHPSVRLGKRVFVGPFVSIDAGAVVDDDCYISQHAYVGENVRIGPKCYLHPNVVLYREIQLGARCILHSGVVIGADGFGFAFDGESYQKFPQVGTVILGDDVELGANACVDRAALGATTIGDGSKLDNMVHIAHNCKIGKHVVIAAQTGFSGGVEIGDYAVIGGQVGMGDRATVAPRAVVGSQAGILPGKHVPAGEAVWGTPARPLRQHLKGLAHVARLSAYQQELYELKRKMENPG